MGLDQAHRLALVRLERRAQDVDTGPRRHRRLFIAVHRGMFVACRRRDLTCSKRARAGCEPETVVWADQI